MELLRYKPAAYWRLDDPTPYQDYSGYNRTAALTGTERSGLALVPDATVSRGIDAASYITMASPVYKRTSLTSEPFSLAVTAKVLIRSNNSEQQIVSNQGQYDGITLEGTKVHFTTRYTNTGLARCTYDLEIGRTVDIVGVHTEFKNSLYVDGVLVDEVDITPEQIADTYIATDASMYCGYSATGQQVLVNDIAIFRHALSGTDVEAMHAYNNGDTLRDVPKAFGGESVPVSSLARPRALHVEFTDETDWAAGQATNVSVDNDQLTANVMFGQTIAGTWATAVNLDATDLTSVSVDWRGENVTVEGSVDGTTWTAITRGLPLTFLGTAPVLFIRVNLLAGVESSVLDYLTVSGYSSNTTDTGTPITYTDPLIVKDEHPIRDLSEDWGVELVGGTISLTAPADTRTVEIWIKRTTAAAVTFSANLAATGTFYSNGVSGSAYPEGEWVVRHFVAGAAITGPITLSGNVQVGKVAFYPTSLTAAQITSLVGNYTRNRKLRTDDGADIIVSEPADSAVAYKHDWQIVASD